MDRAYCALRRNPESRQVALQIWDPASDLPDENGSPVDPDIPCNVGALLKVRDGKLEWLQILRSNDFFLGVPYNFVQFTSLQEVMAGWLGLELGDYNHLCDSLHLYERNRTDVDSIGPVQAEFNTDSLAVSKDRSDQIFAALAYKAEAFTKPDVTARSLANLVEDFEAPQGFRNLLLLLAAEAARRREWSDHADYFVGECANPALKQLWERWYESRREHSVPGSRMYM